MKGSRAHFLVAFGFFLLFFLGCFADELEGDSDGSANKSRHVSDLNVTKMAPPGAVNVVDEEKKDEGQDIGSQDAAKKVPEEDISNGSSSVGKDEPLEEPKMEDSNGSSDGRLNSETLASENSHTEECDPSSRCVDEKKMFIACLRVPGKDTLALSLLIQNKGTGSLDVEIVAPDFVNLEQTTVKLQGKENKEVKVSVSDGANDTAIILKAGEGQCSLNLQSMISNPVGRSETLKLSAYITQPSRASFIYMFLAVVALLAAALLCLRLRWMHRQGGQMYQQVEMGLPVSTGGKKAADDSDGWETSWGDGWDDEEAPKTPSKPVSTSSPKGLSSRRLNKESWKE